MMKKVVFVCIENSARSQMAEAFAKHYGDGKVEAVSAGTMPTEKVNPLAVQVMREKGIDISKNKPKAIEYKDIENADIIITMGCGAEGFCPASFLERVLDWKIEDPKGKTVEEVRKIRDEIEMKVKKLLDDLDRKVD
ncbi:arsenate reductase ArsC [Candidatus Bathyarchaeota archaeon]|nr:arsenate reductase ArsC [Candidatus Bathyarchaeota archaeon]MBS7630142.1 arsenate reductase ArsC [Candidatus Bathyarchaeota archaeon]